MPVAASHTKVKIGSWMTMKSDYLSRNQNSNFKQNKVFKYSKLSEKVPRNCGRYEIILIPFSYVHSHVTKH